MDNSFKGSFTQPTEEFTVKSYDAKIEIKLEESMCIENKSLSLVKLEPVQNYDNNLMKNSFFLSTDIKIDVLTMEMPKNIVKDEPEYFSNEEHCSDLIQDTKLENTEDHLKNETDYGNVEEQVKKETFQEGGTKTQKELVVHIDGHCLETLSKSDNIKCPNFNCSKHRESKDKLEKQDILDKSNKCDYITQHLNNSKILDGVTCKVIKQHLFCQLCNKNFKTKQRFACHIVSVHSDNKTMMKNITCKIYKCDMCEYKTASISHIKTHSKIHKSVKTEQIYQCDLCNYNTIVKEYLKKHIIQVHATERRFFCHICEKKFSKKQSVDRHIVSMHSENKKMMDSVTTTIYKCDMCEYKTAAISHFKTHLPVHKNVKTEQIYQCDICGYKTKIKDYLRNHVQVHVSERKFFCQICDKKFLRKRDLDRHIVSVHSKNKTMIDSVISKVYNCDMCEYKTADISYFKTHLQMKHKDIKTEQMYYCDRCGYKTVTKSNFEKHVQVHESERRFFCHICDKRFLTKHNLDCHIVSKHSKNKKMMDIVTSTIYKCEMCDYKTTAISHLKRHLQRHESIKTEQIYQCDMCCYNTKVKDYLRNHVQIHVSERRFFCQICDKKFLRKFDLNRHIVSMHSENKKMMDNVTSKMYKCDICGYKTVTSICFNRHAKTHKHIKLE